MPFGQETDCVYSTAHMAQMGQCAQIFHLPVAFIDTLQEMYIVN